MAFPVNRNTLEVPDYMKLWSACGRYGSIFGPASLLGDRMPQTTFPGQGLTPWLIEAPLNSVELLEAVLKPSQPFEIYKARHVSPPPPPVKEMPPKPAENEDWLAKMGYRSRTGAEKRRHMRYEEFWKGQGRLMCDREVSFVCLDVAAIETMKKIFNTTYHVVQLNWIHIPWNCGDGQGAWLARPFAIVLGRQPTPGCSYWDWFDSKLENLGLASVAESGFPRSLLEQGTVPLPETLRDWLMGIPGETAALPYFAPAVEEDTEAESCQHQMVLRPRL